MKEADWPESRSWRSPTPNRLVEIVDWGISLASKSRTSSPKNGFHTMGGPRSSDQILKELTLEMNFENGLKVMASSGVLPPARLTGKLESWKDMWPSSRRP
jgi:hypothetical protein